MRSSARVLRFPLLAAIVALALLGCGLLPGGTNQVLQSDEAFSGDRAYTHVGYLSEEIGSRPDSTPKAKQAADYIAAQFRLQRLDVVRPEFEYEIFSEKKVELEVVRPPLGKLRAASLMFSKPGEYTAELVDAGGGRSEDFSGRDVKGKIALMIRGDIPFSAKVSNAANAGAVGALICNNVPGELRGSLGTLSAIPAVGISQEDGQLLLSLTNKDTAVVHLLVEAETIVNTGENVVGEKRGTGGKIVIIGAHYDSVEAGPGANDNASGVGTVIELARVMSAKSYPFELRFIAFGAEEPGLFGSSRYVESLSPEERRNVVAMINFDMVGVGDELVFGGSGDLVKLAKAEAKELGFEAGDLEERYANASDHSSFIQAGMPAVMVYWQEDPNYHTQNDRAEFVRPDRLEASGRVAVGIVAGLAKQKGSGYANAEVGGRRQVLVQAVP